LFDGASDHTDANNYFGGNGTNNLGIATTISLSETKTQNFFEKTSIWTITMLFSHSLGQNRPLVIDCQTIQLDFNSLLNLFSRSNNQ
jgi:hypothetical protein